MQNIERFESLIWLNFVNASLFFLSLKLYHQNNNSVTFLFENFPLLSSNKRRKNPPTYYFFYSHKINSISLKTLTTPLNNILKDEKVLQTL